jgi:hypothetical protein
VSAEGRWYQLASLGIYALGSNVVAHPDDYLAFIHANGAQLFPDAQRACQELGRGVVLLEGEPGGAFVKAWYAEPTADELEGFGPTAAEDFHGYDPEKEMLVGVTDAATFTQFWRCRYS